MKITYIDGIRLKRAIFAATYIINRMQQNLNKINVFPVPDGDTGTNMAYTMNYITKVLSQCSHRSIDAVSSALAEAAMNGAQGNSGAILAQFFNGFAEAVTGKIRLNVASFAEAVKNAKNAAYEAMVEPREGTILTVIKDWTSYVEEKCRKTTDFVELLHSSLPIAKKSLADTPNKLKILAKSGVVDAGAQGFVHILEGITHFIEKGKIIQQIRTKIFEGKIPVIADEKIKFQYCTECMISCDHSNGNQIKSKLSELGDSLIVIHRGDRFKIHIHTNYPEKVLSLAAEFGNITRQKIDDMFAQHKKATKKQSIGLVMDSSCDLPPDYLQKYDVFMVPTKITFGPTTYLDKVEITPTEFYDKLIHSEYHPTSSQPSLASFKKVYEEVVQRYKSVISIHLPRVSSGTLQGAEHAAARYGDHKITCIDGKNVSAALGLVVMEAMQAIEDEEDLERIIHRTKTAAENVYLFAAISTLDYMVKGGRISRPKWLLTKIFNIKPIVSFDKTGKANVVAKGFGEHGLMKKTLQLVQKTSQEYRQVKFMVAHAMAYDKAAWYVEKLREMFQVENIPIVDAAPVLGVHAGPGAAAIAMLGYR